MSKERRPQGPAATEREPSTQHPSTFEEYAAFVQSLQDQGVSAEQFLKRFSQARLDRCLPDLSMAVAVDPSQEREFSIFPQREYERMSEGQRHTRLKWIFGYLMKNNSILMGEGDDYNMVQRRLDKGSLEEYLQRFMDTIWQNRGKRESLDYPEQGRGEQLERIFATAVAQCKRLDATFDQTSGFAWQLLEQRLSARLPLEGGSAAVAMDTVRKAALASRNVESWYRASAFLTRDLDQEEFATLMSEAMSACFRPFRSKQDAPEARERFARLEQAVSAAVHEWTSEDKSTA